MSAYLQHSSNRCAQQKQVTQMHCLWGETATQKIECCHFEQRTSSKKSSANLTVVDWNDNRAVYIVSSKSFESKRFVQRLNKVERKYVQEQNWYPNEKMVVVPFA